MDELVLEMQEKMSKSIDSLKESLTSLRTGRATPSMLNGIEVDYYGSMTPINQMSSVSVPEPRQLIIKPYDKNDMKAILTALNKSDLGINPINEGTQIRLLIPALTEERRRDIVKQAKRYGEETKTAIRNIRRDYVSLVKDDELYTEDYQKRMMDDVEKVTSDFVKDIDLIVADKEKELMTL
ncbi:MAG TPA: ribosome recycling factor [Erysipelotrichaceae bacterium]|nr:ribosome recycling factor [Erysipelotrichaceae bacterium]